MTKEVKEFIEELIECNEHDESKFQIIQDKDDFYGLEYEGKGYITVFYTDEDLKCLTPEELKEFLNTKEYLTSGSIETSYRSYDDYFTDEFYFKEIEYRFKKTELEKEVA